jgi:hypothetical protein
MVRRAGVAAVLVLQLACVSLEGLRQLVQPPRFEQAQNQPAEFRVSGPTSERPLGGAVVRIWTKVTNPNPFGFKLSTLDGTLYLEGARAASTSFPLGLPLGARQESVIPLELAIDAQDLPALADVIRRAARREPIGYRLDGTVGVDAGQLGQPVFGPMTLLRGNVQAR